MDTPRVSPTHETRHGYFPLHSATHNLTWRGLTKPVIYMSSPGSHSQLDTTTDTNAYQSLLSSFVYDDASTADLGGLRFVIGASGLIVVDDLSIVVLVPDLDAKLVYTSATVLLTIDGR